MNTCFRCLQSEAEEYHYKNGEWLCPGDPTIQDLINALAEEHAESVIPDCRLCGAELKMSGSGGGGLTTYVCRRAQKKYFHRPEECWNPETHGSWKCEIKDHYRDSTYEDRRHPDYKVRWLIALLEDDVDTSRVLEGFNVRWDDE